MVKLKADFEANWIAQVRCRMTETWGTEVARIPDRDVAIHYFHSFHRRIARRARSLRIADDFRCPPGEEIRWKALQDKVLSGKDLNASRNAGFFPAVSDLALIIEATPDESFAHEGIRPQRISDNSRMGSFGFCRTTGTGWVGAML
jgi:hypothetical protein